MTKPKNASKTGNDTNRVEGEGSYTATHRYNDGLKRSVDTGKSDELAQEAKEALEGPEGAELERAAQIAKKGNPKTNTARR